MLIFHNNNAEHRFKFRFKKLTLVHDSPAPMKTNIMKALHLQ